LTSIPNSPKPEGSWRLFLALEGVPAREPVLLVHALVYSRWTLTVVGTTLLAAGSGPVSPFVLANALSD
jgi:hypothetical protein